MKHPVHAAIATFFPFVFLLWSFQCDATCTLPAPPGLKPISIQSCSVNLKWKPVNGAAGYSLQYKLSTSTNWTTINNIGNVTSYVLTGLIPSTAYNMKVAAMCPSNETGVYTAPVTVTTVSCTTPSNVTVTNISSSSAYVSWSVVCNATKFSMRYRKVGVSAWTTVGNINSTNYTLSGLQPNTAYQLKVKSKCGNKTSLYSPLASFTTLSSVGVGGKNVLLVIIDDARFDSYANMGAPPFFDDSTISRIATEGVNFKYSFPVLSMCAPSRASIATGLYPHIHGVTDNPPTSVSDTILQTTLAEVMHDHGYYTGLIGKYHVSKFPQPGYDYWMEVHNNDYTDTKYDVNGQFKTILGHQTDVITDSAIGFLHKVPPGKPFYLWFAYFAPHSPHTPRPQEDGIYDNDTMPFPSNYVKYTENAPEFLYDCHFAHDSSFIDDFWRGYYECLTGVEVDLAKVFAELKTMGIMDSTLIIFMSDNGYLIGEHQLLEKQLSYEESIRIPIFMRYPGLITPGTQVTDQLATNIDIAPTILDFAGIDDTFGMQGVSLLKLMNNTASRKEMMYEFFNKDCVPDIRAVRSFDYKYVQYNCTEVTGEFFDLNNDPQENTNLINNPAYATLIQEYQDKLTYWRNYYQDYTWDSLYECSLTNPQRLEHASNTPLTLMNVFPNPSSTSITAHFISSEKTSSTIRILDAIGNTMYSEILDDPELEFSKTFSVEGWTAGNYFVVIQHGAQTYQHSFVVQ